MLVQFQNCSFVDNYRSTLIAENITLQNGTESEIIKNY